MNVNETRDCQADDYRNLKNELLTLIQVIYQSFPRRILQGNAFIAAETTEYFVIKMT